MFRNNLPRDIELKVIKYFDMDTRIKTHVIGKLNVPDTLIHRLDRIMTKRKNSIRRLEEDMTTEHVVTFPLSQYKYYECYYDKSENQMYWYLVNTTSMYNGDQFPKLSVLFPTCV
jgi:hypothetical protein